MTIPLVMVDPHFWKASAYFNPNAFPEHVKGDAAACGDRLAILTHSVEMVVREPALSASALLRQLRENPAFGTFKPPPDKPTVVIFHNLSFLSGVYATLISAKSLLDVYSRLVAKLLVPSATIFGFSKGQYMGRKMAGGRFLKWIDSSVPAVFAKRSELVSVLLRHVEDWIDEAVAHRDAIVHDGFLAGMQEAMVPFHVQVDHLRESDLVLPTMPGGRPVPDYCTMLVGSARSLVSETLVLLPSVNLKLLSPEDDDPRTAHPSERMP